jgi:hypothetical protein
MIKSVSQVPPARRSPSPRVCPHALPEQWAKDGPLERFLVRHLGSRIAIGMFDTIVHPGVYGTIGLPTWKTWQAVNRSAGRTALRHQALRPLLTQLVEAGVFRAGRIPPGWRRASGVDRHGNDLAPAAAGRLGPRATGPARADRLGIVRFAREGYQARRWPTSVGMPGSRPRRRTRTSPARKRCSWPRWMRTWPISSVMPCRWWPLSWPPSTGATP